MCAETINESIRVCKYLGTEKKQKIIEGEMILPDIKPDILSIVKLSGKICLNHVEVDTDKILLGGIVNIHVIYIADDDTNSQRGAAYELAFSETINVNGITPDTIARVRYDIGNIEYKIHNGRKIMVKVPITFQVKAFANCDINIVRGITEDNQMEVQKTTCSICKPMQQGNTQIELKENVPLDTKNSPIGEILDYDISIVNQEYKLSYNKILAKADARVKIVYVADNESQSVENFEVLLPLMGIIDMEGINDESSIKLEYWINQFSVRPVYQDRQANSISVEMNVRVNAYVYGQNEIELITDFYTPNAIIQLEKESNPVLKNMIDVEDSWEISQTLVVPELDHTNILNMTGNVFLNEKNILNGKIAVIGNIEIYMLFCKAGNHLIESKKLDLPFQQVIKVENLNSNMEPMIHVRIDKIEGIPVGENQLQVTLQLKANVVTDEEETMNSIHKIIFCEEAVPMMPSMVIYYVKPGDSLWNIAKQFRNRVDVIKEFNDLKEDTIYPGQRLLIPRLVMANAKATIM